MRRRRKHRQASRRDRGPVARNHCQAGYQQRYEAPVEDDVEQRLRPDADSDGEDADGRSKECEPLGCQPGRSAQVRARQAHREPERQDTCDEAFRDSSLTVLITADQHAGMDQRGKAERDRFDREECTDVLHVPLSHAQIVETSKLFDWFVNGEA